MGRIIDYTEKVTMDGTEEFVGSDSGSTFKILAPTLKSYMAQSAEFLLTSEVLTGSVTKTLASSGGDFSTVEQFLTWLNGTVFRGASLQLDISPGNYTFPIDTTVNLSPDGLTSITFSGQSKGTTYLDMEWSSGMDYYGQFQISGCSVTFMGVTLRSVGSGSPIFMFARNSTVTIDSCDITNFVAIAQITGGTLFVINSDLILPVGASGYAIASYGAGHIYLVKALIDCVDQSSVGIDLYGSSLTAKGATTTIRNCSVGLNVDESSMANIVGTITYTNNVTDESIPRNVVQGDGSLIADGGLDVLHKSEVLTGQITKTLAASGGDFSSLTEFFDWVEVNVFSNASVILDIEAGGTFTLDGATYYISAGTGISYMEFSGNFASPPTINIDMTGLDGESVFVFRDIVTRFDNLTLNNVGGDPYLLDNESGHVWLVTVDITGFNTAIFGWANGNYKLSGVDVVSPTGGSDSYLVIIEGGSTMNVSSCSFDNDNNAQGTAFYVDAGGQIFANNVSIFDANTGILVEDGGVFNSQGAITFSNCVTDTVIPLNVVQSDGSYISDSTGLAFPNVFNHQIGTTYTIQDSDNGKVLTFENGSPIAVTLPDGLSAGFNCSIIQLGAGVPTVTPNTDTVNGAGGGVTPSAQWKKMELSKFSSTEWVAVL